MKHDAASGHSRIRIEPGSGVRAIRCGRGVEHVLASVTIGNRARGQMPLSELGQFLAALAPSPTLPMIIAVANRGTSPVTIEFV
jgi:hypothetical protein